MTTAEHNRFNKLRKKVADEIRRQLEEDDYCKPYEGTWELLVAFPSYFEDKTATAKPDYYEIMLHCYVIGPARHYDWHGRSWDECLQSAEEDILAWIGRGESE